MLSVKAMPVSWALLGLDNVMLRVDEEPPYTSTGLKPLLTMMVRAWMTRLAEAAAIGSDGRAAKIGADIREVEWYWHMYPPLRYPLRPH